MTFYYYLIVVVWLERFEMIKDAIANMQLTGSVHDWMIAGDWNTNLADYKEMYQETAYAIGGHILDPGFPTFMHRNKNLSQTSRIDLTMTKIKNVEFHKMDWPIESDHVPILATFNVRKRCDVLGGLVTDEEKCQFKMIFEQLTDFAEANWQQYPPYELGVWCTQMAVAIVNRHKFKPVYRFN